MDASEAIRLAQSVIRRRRAATWCTAGAALLMATALGLGVADAALALGDQVRRVTGWLWLAAAPCAFAALALRWHALAPATAITIRRIESACGDTQRSLAQAIELDRQGGELASAGAAALAARLPLGQLPDRLPRARLGGWLALLVAVLAIAGLAWVGAPRLSGTVLARWIDPLGDHPPWSPTALVWAEAPASVRARHNARIEVAAEGRPCAAPVLVVQNADGRADRIAMFPVGPARWAAEITRIERPLTLWAEGGNTRTRRHQLIIDPVPELTSLDLRLVQPAYAALPPAERRLRPGEHAQFDALPGAIVWFAPSANRPIRAVQLAHEDGEWQRLPLTSGPVSIAAEPGRWRLRLEAVDGALGEAVEPLRLGRRTDQPPRLTFAQPSRDAYATPDSIVPVHAHGEDDLGLRAAERAREVNGLPVPTPPVTASGRTWDWRASLDLTRLGANPGDVIALTAMVRDSDPVTAADGRAGKPSEIVMRRVQVVGWDEYNRYLLQRLDVNALENKYRPLAAELAELQKLAAAIKAAQPAPDELDRQLKELAKRANALAAKVEGLRRPKPLFRLEPDLQQALAEAARDLAEGKTPRWDAESLRRDLAELTQRARAADLLRRFGQLTDAEQNTVERLLPLAGHRRPSDGDLLRLSELGQQEELLATELGNWLKLARAWAERNRADLPKESTGLSALATELEDGGAIGLKQRAAAAARSGDGREAHRLAGEARDRLLALLPKAGQCAGSCTGGACLGMGWCDKLGADLGGLLGCAGQWGLGGRGAAGMGLWLGYGGDDLGGSMPGEVSDLYGPENMGASGSERQQDGGDPIGAMAAAGHRVALGHASRARSTARTAAANRSTLGEDERRLVETYFRSIEEAK